LVVVLVVVTVPWLSVAVTTDEEELELTLPQAAAPPHEGRGIPPAVIRSSCPVPSRSVAHALAMLRKTAIRDAESNDFIRLTCPIR
jgi:hypothetical protein